MSHLLRWGARPLPRFILFCVTLGCVLPAFAHGVDEIDEVPPGLMRASITGLPELQGLQVMVLDGTRPGLLVAYRGDDELALFGLKGEPFLRFTAEGVFANTRSGTWQAMQPSDSGYYPDADAGPAWRAVSASGSYGWLDPRLTRERLPGKADSRQPLGTWQIPLSLSGEAKGAISGRLYWQPL